MERADWMMREILTYMYMYQGSLHGWFIMNQWVMLGIPGYAYSQKKIVSNSLPLQTCVT
mgnify:CR=1 FL=1